jgi:hypothetical protein
MVDWRCEDQAQGPRMAVAPTGRRVIEPVVVRHADVEESDIILDRFEY